MALTAGDLINATNCTGGVIGTDIETFVNRSDGYAWYFWAPRAVLDLYINDVFLSDDRGTFKVYTGDIVTNAWTLQYTDNMDGGNNSKDFYRAGLNQINTDTTWGISPDVNRTVYGDVMKVLLEVYYGDEQIKVNFSNNWSYYDTATWDSIMKGELLRKTNLTYRSVASGTSYTPREIAGTPSVSQITAAEWVRLHA